MEGDRNKAIFQCWGKQGGNPGGDGYVLRAGTPYVLPLPQGVGGTPTHHEAPPPLAKGGGVIKVHAS